MTVKENKIEKVGRRSFLKRSWGWLGIIASLEFTALAESFLWPRKKLKEADDSNIYTVGKTEQIVSGSVIPFKKGQFYFVRLADGGMLALSLHCTHLGCSISYSNQKEAFICHCHASSFDLVGNVLNPPAPRALDIYPVIIENGEVKVDTGRLIKRKKYSSDDLTYA